jgi:hypothetical protein
MSDRPIGLLLLGACAFFYWQSTFIRKSAFAAFETLGAETYPRAVIAALALFSLVLVLRGRGLIVPRVAPRGIPAWLRRYRLPLASLPLFLGYAVVIPFGGWYVATALYLILMQLLLWPRRGRQFAYVLAGSLAFTWALGTTFERFLHVVLPRASLF